MPPPPRPGTTAPGDQLGPYRIVRRLGRGGMGTVYEAVDTVLERRVALKLIVPELADDPDFRARFVREARAQASLDSPHVVPVFAHGEIDGRLYLVSQLVPDGDLGAALRAHGPLPPGEAADLVAQVADGLAEAHRAGLAHRDVKPANVLLRRRGTHTVAYLADFGIAGRAGGDPDRGVAGDLEALGRLLGACLTGRAPYDGRPVGRLPRGLARVLRDALAGDYPSAAALRDDLRSSVPARPGRRPARRSRRPRRPRRIAQPALAAAITAVLVGSVTVLTRDDSPARRRPEVAALAHALERDAALDPAVAGCTARALAAGHGVRRLDELPRDAVLTAAARCLWPSPPPAR
ncbi:serine/threonine-protein kinase [Nocardioides sp. LHD-245]|uniref:serine/threonine-protein kinase n=1 Tax=Nocardioides sp. LHD-245 TaxID=3051387 RepID=UPI0027DF3551|nr:serine/threonine-protein kinase [Nocardioides sp. LHD-245]